MKLAPEERGSVLLWGLVTCNLLKIETAIRMSDIVYISAAVCSGSRLGRVLMSVYASDSFWRMFYSQIELQSA